MRGMRGTRECLLGFRGISLRILRNAIILTFRGIFQKIPGNAQEDFGKSKFRFIL